MDKALIQQKKSGRLVPPRFGHRDNRTKTGCIV
ncbi:hypothetical protein N826_06845 [Skermanella aerolata KACC 11604]|nr:hypothetical protein N826_06845 [Skermanella aerolata KACC 11604]